MTGHFEHIDEFHKHLGYGVAAWAQVDEVLFKIFQRCVGPWQQCAIIYYRTPGLDVRLNLVDEIVRAILPKPEKPSGAHPHPDVKVWHLAKSSFSDLLGTRRRIAHQQVAASVYITGDYPSIEEFSARLSIEVSPSYQERLRGRDSDVTAAGIDVAGLKKHRIDVEALARRLSDFLQNELQKYSSKLPQQVPLD